MKIRSVLELQEFLDRDLARRKQEVTALSFALREAREHQKVMLRRAASLLFYAHWEGFIKRAAVAYLSFVLRQEGPARRFRPNFLILGQAQRLAEAGRSKKNEIHTGFVVDLFRSLDSSLTFDPMQAINTESNVSSSVLRDILHTLGFEYDAFWQTKENVIDYKLLQTRNRVAHGELYDVDPAHITDMRALIDDSLGYLKTTIENAASQQYYYS